MDERRDGLSVGRMEDQLQGLSGEYLIPESGIVLIDCPPGHEQIISCTDVAPHVELVEAARFLRNSHTPRDFASLTPLPGGHDKFHDLGLVNYYPMCEGTFAYGDGGRSYIMSRAAVETIGVRRGSQIFGSLSHLSWCRRISLLPFLCRRTRVRRRSPVTHTRAPRDLRSPRGCC